MNEHECFAYQGGKCKALKGPRCQGVNCGFHKTKEQQNDDHQQALERIRLLPLDRQEHIMEKYYHEEHSQ